MYGILRGILIGDGNEDPAPSWVWDGDGKKLNILGRVWDRGARPKPALLPSLDRAVFVNNYNPLTRAVFFNYCNPLTGPYLLTIITRRRGHICQLL